MSKKTVATETNSAVETTKREVAFPKATIMIDVVLSGTSALDDEQIAEALGLVANEEPSVLFESVLKAIRAADPRSGKMKLYRAKSGNLMAKLPLNGVTVRVAPKGANENRQARSENDKARDAMAAFGVALEG